MANRINVAWEIEEVDVDSLKPHPDNARHIDPEALGALRSSVKTFGLVELIILNIRSGFVIGGHQRLQILREEGIKRTKVMIVDLDEAEEAALRLVLNNPKAQGKFTDQVADILAQLENDREDLFRSLRLDEMRPADKAPVGVYEVPTTTVMDTFLITITGPLPQQPEVLEVLRQALRDIGHEVDCQIITQRVG